MNINDDQIAIESLSKNAQSLQTLVSGPLYSSLSSLSSSSQTLPSNQEFHFFKNFDEFNLPIDQITKLSDSLLQSIGSSTQSWSHNNKAINVPNNIAGDEAYNWIVDVNDEIMQKFEVCMEESGNCTRSEPDINGLDSVGDSVSGKEVGCSSNSRVKAKEKKKSKIPFHVPTIRKPQEVYKIVVDNSNQSFEHVGLEKSEDGQRFVHPLENLSVMDFVDKDIADIEPIKPPSIESTPFKLVEEVKDLEELAAKLHSVNEFAVDLEHNQYRSFQGLTCLMQISTRTEDFIVDTLKLRIHVGPYLRELFKDPTKKKVLHGADRDIVWLQRDFGIYICNMFDTGQASRVLKMERNSLEHLLQHFCGVTANKEYQNADWRLRPLTAELLRYGREDTHYLLYIYDLMRIKLLSMPMEPENCDAPLVEVYKRSSDVCMQLYEKELLTENSYLHLYGLRAAGFNANQLAIAAGLCEWRDPIARSEDESTGYVLPNKVLLEIAKQMPLTSGKLQRLLKSKQPYVEDNLGKVVSIIKRSIQNAASFEAVAQQLKVARALHASEEHVAVKDRALNGISMSASESQSPPSAKATGATLRVLKKPNHGFGALLGNAATKRKLNIYKKKEESKLKQIRYSVNLSSPSILGTEEQSKPPTAVATESTFKDDSNDGSEISPPTVVATKSTSEDVIILEDDSDEDEPIDGDGSPTSETNKGYNEETVSLSDLSPRYKPCTQSSKVKKSKEQSSPSQFKPFDYTAAIKFGGDTEQESGIRVNFDIQARLRQVFPASGNRSATFR